jgi:hypothetical protein
LIPISIVFWHPYPWYFTIGRGVKIPWLKGLIYHR